jgi:hypothetical protein
MKISDLVTRRCGSCVYFRAVSVPKAGFCTVYNKDTSPDDKCEYFSNIATMGGLQRIKTLIEQENKE